MARRSKADALLTRETILESAGRVLLRQGMSRTNIEDVASEAGVTRGAVYWHFAGKDDLLTTLCTSIHTPIDAAYVELSEDSAIDELKVFSIRVLQEISSDSNAFRLLHLGARGFAHKSDHKQALQQKRSALLKAIEAIFGKAAEQNELVTDVTPQFAAQYLHSFVSGVLWDYLTMPKSYPLAQIANQLVESLFKGIMRS